VTVTRTSTSPEQTAALARGLAFLLRPGDLVRLEGELGAGKTTLVRSIAAGLGADARLVSSPTFVIVNQYPAGEAARSRAIDEIVHVDAYRLRSPEDLDSVGWDRLADSGTRGARPGSVMLVEWPERIDAALPPRESCLAVRLRAVDETSREITLDIPSSWHDRPEAALLAEREPKRCPITGEWVEPTRASYPFANDRARMADLGRWFGDSYRISREATPDDLE